MKDTTRRQALRRLGGLALSLGSVGLLAGPSRAQDAGRVIEIEARRFKYTPNEIHAKQGETITLALHSVDFIHGFNLPDFGVRADLVPGQITRVRIEAVAVGRFTFLCDNFCGDKHEEMNGLLIVDA